MGFDGIMFRMKQKLFSGSLSSGGCYGCSVMSFSLFFFMLLVLLLWWQGFAVVCGYGGRAEGGMALSLVGSRAAVLV